MIYFRPMEIMLVSLIIWIGMIPLFFFLISVDIITIEYNYLDELNQCKLDLKNTQPICPEVKVKSSGWFFPMFIGLLWGIILQELWIKYQNEKKLRKTKQESKK
ncbi:hypothetical protein LCGC14_2686300 [marine sediment metagenome]|uniref:Uncharacterized protein n=1 Tax=marine sediment metagenome TaxID=412755 RepID=A0A0F8ZJV9_9ZZZZ